MSIRRLRQAILMVLAFTIVMASVAYSGVLQRGYVVVKFASVLIGGTALLALCSFVLATGKRWRELRDPLFYLLVGEVVALLVSITFSGQPMVSWLGSMPRQMGTITILCFVMAAVAVVVGAGRRRRNLLFLLRVVGITGIAVALNAMYEWPEHVIFRPPGLVGNSEFLANYLLFGALGSFGLMLKEQRTGWWITAMLSTAVSSVGMAVLQTRGAWLGFGAGVAVFLLTTKPWKQPQELISRTLIRLALLVGVTFGVAVLAAVNGYLRAFKPIGWYMLLPFLPVFGMILVVVPWLLPRVRVIRHLLVGLIVSVTALTGYSVVTQSSILPFEVSQALRVTQESARGIVREDTVSMLSKYWLRGCGIENFRVAFLEFKSERVARADPRVNYRNPHNMFLYEWTANGLLGVSVYVGLILIGIWSLLLARRREESTGWGMLASGLLATLVAYLVQNIFNYDVIPTGLMFYVVLGMALVLRREAGKEAPTEAPEPEEAEAPRPEPSKSKRKRRRKRAAQPTGRARRAAAREAELKAQDNRWMVLCLSIGLGGAAALFIFLYGLPSVKALFSFSIEELKPFMKEAPKVKTDILPWEMILVWVSVWTIALFSGPIFRRGEGKELGPEDAKLPSHSWFSLAPVLAVCVGLGSWWAGQQIQADWHMYRALAYSKAAGRQLLPRVQQYQTQLRQLKRQESMMRQRGGDTSNLSARFDYQRRSIEKRIDRYMTVIRKLLDKTLKHGYIGATAVDSLGYYHFQFSKALHPYLKARGYLKDYNEVLLTSLKHAKLGVKSNTNPESAWSHLSVVYLACGNFKPERAKSDKLFKKLTKLKRNNLKYAKEALARSIAYDKFYYDTHRMMALLHLQSSHLELARKEMDRSLDITEGRHWVNSKTAAVAVLRAIQKGDDAAADKARRKLWYWLIRSRNLHGIPRLPLMFANSDEKLAVREAVAKDIAAGKLGRARKRLRRARRDILKRMSRMDRDFLRGLLDAVAGDSGRALRRLYHLRRKKTPKLIIDEVIQLTTALRRIEVDAKRLFDVVFSDRADERVKARLMSQIISRAMVQKEEYFKIFGYKIAELIDDGELAKAKKAAKAVAALTRGLYNRQRKDFFPPPFRRLYRQVIGAVAQVDRATSMRGRLAKAQMMLQRKNFKVVLRIAKNTLKRFPGKAHDAWFLEGAALDALQRPDEARPAFQKYLELEPNGRYADRVKQRLGQK